MSRTLAEKIAIAIPYTFTDYKGFRWWWDEVEPENRLEIHKALVEVIQSITDGTYASQDHLESDVDELYNSAPQECPNCAGSGECQECLYDEDENCEMCGGSRECSRCEGNGEIQAEEDEE